MLAQQVAKKYSAALFELAREKDLIDIAWDQFNSLAEFLRKDEAFLDFMEAPQISEQNKMALVKKVFESRLERPFYDFLLVLVRKRRIRFLPEIVEYFDNLVREDKGIARATCISATSISEAERKEIIAGLERKTSLRIELEERVDESLIGGMVVMVREQIIDGSIRHGLDLLRNRLLKVKVH
ncbi:MAG: ATP synthase F1 subunit delta [Candidatus Zixiibacteriota bacterium]|nr:MAG: ATP synthase F1 subunit delta [candidate division Zixibacteria bacterium]